MFGGEGHDLKEAPSAIERDLGLAPVPDP